jgi:hypothetical protein
MSNYGDHDDGNNDGPLQFFAMDRPLNCSVHRNQVFSYLLSLSDRVQSYAFRRDNAKIILGLKV